MGFAEGYRKGKVYGLGVGIVMVVIMILVIESGACQGEPVKVGDKTTCLYLSQSVSKGDTIEESMVDEREAIIDSVDFLCIHHFMLYKERKFSQDLEAETMLLPEHFVFEKSMKTR